LTDQRTLTRWKVNGRYRERADVDGDGLTLVASTCQLSSPIRLFDALAATFDSSGMQHEHPRMIRDLLAPKNQLRALHFAKNGLDTETIHTHNTLRIPMCVGICANSGNLAGSPVRPWALEL